MKISFSIQAWEEYLYFQSQDKKTLKKINELIKDIERNGVLNGIGKPEKLTNNLSGLYSRRINDKDRLVYKLGAGHENIEVYEITEATPEYYRLNDVVNKTPEYVEKEFINERDVLWYFKGKSFYKNEWCILCGATRQTIPNVEELYKGKEEVMFWTPMYNLGFKLKEN